MPGSTAGADRAWIWDLASSGPASRGLPLNREKPRDLVIDRLRVGGGAHVAKPVELDDLDAGSALVSSRRLDELRLVAQADGARQGPRRAPAGAVQIGRPIFREGLEQWRSYEPWLDPLKTALGAALESWRAGRPSQL
jgi:hypothetical protein